MRSLINQAVFGANKEEAQARIKRMAQKAGVFFASTQKLYEKVAQGEIGGFTVPAFNIRTLTFDVARAVFRVAKKEKAGAFILELAMSEMDYTGQSPEEYALCCLAAAIEEKFKGPLFLQGDHFKPANNLEDLIAQAIKANFYNVDIDCSALSLENNFIKTAYFTNFVRKTEPRGKTIAVGGEVGEIGGKNTTVEDLEEFIKGYRRELSKCGDTKGIIKLAVQTGTSHGGGGQIDWQLLGNLSEKARECGLAGIVQHGASVLPEESFKKFPKAGVLEIHLATEFQNIVLESPYFPQGLKEKVTKELLGKFKKEIWDISQKSIDKICGELEEKFIFFFKALQVSGTKDLIRGIYY